MASFHQFAALDPQSRRLRQRDDHQRHHPKSARFAQHRRHQPRLLQQRAYFQLPYRCRRRLHHDQIRLRRRRPPNPAPLPEHHHHQLHHAPRARRGGHRQRNVRRRPQCRDLQLRLLRHRPRNPPQIPPRTRQCRRRSPRRQHRHGRSPLPDRGQSLLRLRHTGKQQIARSLAPAGERPAPRSSAACDSAISPPAR